MALGLIPVSDAMDDRETPMALVGLDIGGTKTHAMRWHGDKLLADAKAGSANIQNVTREVAELNIAEVFAALGTGPIHRVIAGAGGIDTEEDAQRLRSMIAVHAPGALIEVVHDTRLILAAGRVSTGIAVILGTGSAAWGVNTAGSESRSGGWGYLLGDEASGYWFAREAVRHTLREFNRGLPPGELGRRVLEANSVTSPDALIGLFHGPADRRYWAQQSPLVFDAWAAGDPTSAGIIAEAVGHVRAMVGEVSTALGITGPIIIGGGLGMHQPVLQRLISEALLEAGLWEPVFLTDDPVAGVQFLARSR